MQGCEFCRLFKDLLNKESIPFEDYDINQYREEYENFSRATNNAYVPSFIIFEDGGGEGDQIKMFAPERDFKLLEDGINLVKKELGLLGDE